MNDFHSSKKDHTIFLRNLPLEVDRDELREFLEKTLSQGGTEVGADSTVGDIASLPMFQQKQTKRIKSLHLAKDHETGHSRGFAFVAFHIALVAKEAIKKLNGVTFQGRKLQALAQGDKKQNKQEQGEQDSDNVKDVVVRGLPLKHDIKTTESMLKKRFSSVGVITNVRIPADKRSKPHHPRASKVKHMGYAFVSFQKAVSAKFAVKHFNDKKLDKQDKQSGALTVDLMLQREEYLAIKEKLKDAIEKKTKGENKSKKKEVAKDDENDSDSDYDLDAYDDIDLGDDFKIKTDMDEDFEENDHEEHSEGDDVDVAVKDEEMEKEGQPKKRKKTLTKDVSNTFFLSNLAFDVDRKELLDLFQNRYGEVQYLALVKNEKTGLCRGSAFLRFKRRDSFNTLHDELQTATRLLQLEAMSDPVALKSSSFQRPVIDGLKIDNRDLYVQTAKPKEEMDRQKSQEETEKLKQKDKRNLSLANIGLSTIEEENYPDAMRKLITKSFREKNKLLKEKNHMFVSPVRLRVNFIPGSMRSQQLKKMFLDAARDVKRHGKPRIVQCKIIRESATARQNTFRYGFVEFQTPEHARAALEAINGDAGILKQPSKGREKIATARLFCDYALADVFKLRRLEKSKEMGALNSQKKEEEEEDNSEDEDDGELAEEEDDDEQVVARTMKQKKHTSKKKRKKEQKPSSIGKKRKSVAASSKNATPKGKSPMKKRQKISTE